MMTSPMFAWGLTVSLTLWSADPARDPKMAVTKVAEADADFAVQGEYAGCINWCGRVQSVGVQLVAHGDGEFQGLLYPGGLPGNGYNGAAKTAFTGKRDGNTVALQGESLQVHWQEGRALTVSDAQGHPLGYLQRLERSSPFQGARPPANARILFDGTDTGHLKDLKISEDGLMQIGAETVEPVSDFYIHGEFKTPYMPYARGQARGNSGFYLQRRYEVQLLDSFGMEPAVNEAASIYKFKSPDLNMSFPPLSWQTYDIYFTAARFDANGQKTQKARLTVIHNGVIVQNSVELENKTGGGRVEGPEPLPILFQNHGNPVEYRNLWLVDLTPTPCPPAIAGCSTTAASCSTTTTTPTCCHPCRTKHTPRKLFRRCR